MLLTAGDAVAVDEPAAAFARVVVPIVPDSSRLSFPGVAIVVGTTAVLFSGDSLTDISSLLSSPRVAIVVSSSTLLFSGDPATEGTVIVSLFSVVPPSTPLVDDKQPSSGSRCKLKLSA